MALYFEAKLLYGALELLFILLREVLYDPGNFATCVYGCVYLQELSETCELSADLRLEPCVLCVFIEML